LSAVSSQSPRCTISKTTLKTAVLQSKRAQHIADILDSHSTTSGVTKMSVKISIKRQSISEFITDAIAASPKTQKEIADNMGLENANLITMYKSGACRVPLNRIHSLGIALNVDSWFLLRLALLEYYPEVHSVLETLLPSPILTQNEIAMLKSFRELTDYADPAFVFHGPETKIVASYIINRPAPAVM
jgi:transcriptional regulator with XRE-family HTH domain